MQAEAKTNNYLIIKAQTWGKDSHSLFDYESTKISIDNFSFPIKLSKHICLYRKKEASTVVACNNNFLTDLENYQLLTQISVKNDGNKIQLVFPTSSQQKINKLNSNEKLKTEESISSITIKEEQTYIIVPRKSDQNHQQDKGYPLNVGQSIKLGRVQYYLSQMCINGKQLTANPNPKTNKFFSENTLTYLNNKSQQNTKGELNACKICLDEFETQSNFLFNPCKCSGSCGTVHFECLLHWIRIKVKKEVVGGTIHYNFQKFECEVCKAELPMIIETEKQKFQLLPITKPNGNYLILEAACQKSKSVMMIQNIPNEGIKLGRGHECQIRITDISVSRNHALIKYINNSFTILDNKSKFGTLIRQDNMTLDLSKHNKGVQIGRTILTFQLKKQKP